MKHFRLTAALVLGMAIGTVTPALAEVATVRLAKQFGIGYLPLTLIEEQGLLEKHAQEAGLELRTEWLRFTGGSGMNEALLSGNLDIAAGGVGPMLTIWARTQNNLQVKGIAALESMPLYLVTTDPEVQSLADFNRSHKIALPAVKTSIQAITLQMAAEKYLGEGRHDALDAFTVSMGHPDAQLAMMGGRSEINAHFGAPPFQNQELKDERAHKVLDSYEVLGGPHTFNVIWAKNEFVENNPTVMAALMAALEESIGFIRDNPDKAARIWAEVEATNLSHDEVVDLITDERVNWTTAPQGILPYVEYMSRVGLISASTDDWRDVFFDMVHDTEGS
ncbi:ABC transporter substrate-binding protein [Paracoccus siganidrum]|uniref:ABC transporter substrate-binding protein n=1 Tax=Paracoccus siganidrum TaxID=1276757 RepID=A0A419ACI3_9RHOB|nr:ABC transporter substrate-binding protein [Paracoccus siganidrum]RJL22659.1 ABC transporter substrate-binding protein [Paracoccus siganidrum]RMC39687.1 ABC transporter substrate-binding protein [Paracoccus siganidrum]